ncbi:hypothetical protein MFUL124B02_40815 [Myxococcus fulvus 124B02]|nr:hypothetical protein MFUL124B02_40815 [Myxococcus fulvus 124B02]
MSALALTGLGINPPAWASEASSEVMAATGARISSVPEWTVSPNITARRWVASPESVESIAATTTSAVGRASSTPGVTAPAWAAAPNTVAPSITAQRWVVASTGATTPSTTASSPRPTEAKPTVRHRVTAAEAPRHIIANGKGRATLFLNESTGATAASLTLLELQPGGEVPEHTHESSAEILYIEDGAADMTVSGQTLRVSKGDAVYIPAGAKHSARVVSPGVPFKAVQVYAGPGPEQRFTQGPRESAPHGR